MLNKLVNVFVATPEAKENTATKAKKEKLSPLEVRLLMLERKKKRLEKELQK